MIYDLLYLQSFFIEMCIYYKELFWIPNEICKTSEKYDVLIAKVVLFIIKIGLCKNLFMWP